MMGTRESAMGGAKEEMCNAIQMKQNGEKEQ
jgi:hypothetical protein